MIEVEPTHAPEVRQQRREREEQTQSSWPLALLDPVRPNLKSRASDTED